MRTGFVALFALVSGSVNAAGSSVGYEYGDPAARFIGLLISRHSDLLRLPL
jgi:hypothetical protein